MTIRTDGDENTNEEHLSKAKVEVPDSWDGVLEISRKLKADGISDAPYHSAWGQKWPELSWSLFSCWYSEGAKVFDDDGGFVDDARCAKYWKFTRHCTRKSWLPKIS